MINSENERTLCEVLGGSECHYQTQLKSNRNDFHKAYEFLPEVLLKLLFLENRQQRRANLEHQRRVKTAGVIVHLVKKMHLGLHLF